jgi:hypothetical protein
MKYKELFIIFGGIVSIGIITRILSKKIKIFKNKIEEMLSEHDSYSGSDFEENFKTENETVNESLELSKNIIINESTIESISISFSESQNEDTSENNISISFSESESKSINESTSINESITSEEEQFSYF